MYQEYLLYFAVLLNFVLFDILSESAKKRGGEEGGMEKEREGRGKRSP